jgi:uncharacterized protein (TIGR02594 family)
MAYENVPAKWRYLTKLQGCPLIVLEGLKEYGRFEGAGTSNNPVIVNWADEVARLSRTNYTNWAADWYTKDSVPWCGLFAAICAVRSAGANKNRMPPNSYLAAASWASFGDPVQWRGREGLRLNNILLGDIAVFTRTGGNHVGIVIGVTTDGKYLFVLGGNQDNGVNIKMMPITRLYSVRRPRYNIRPAGATHLRIKSTGEVSNSQA